MSLYAPLHHTPPTNSFSFIGEVLNGVSWGHRDVFQIGLR